MLKLSVPIFVKKHLTKFYDMSYCILTESRHLKRHLFTCLTKIKYKCFSLSVILNFEFLCINSSVTGHYTS